MVVAKLYLVVGSRGGDNKIMANRGWLWQVVDGRGWPHDSVMPVFFKGNI